MSAGNDARVGAFTVETAAEIEQSRPKPRRAWPQIGLATSLTTAPVAEVDPVHPHEHHGRHGARGCEVPTPSRCPEMLMTPEVIGMLLTSSMRRVRRVDARRLQNSASTNNSFRCG
jgi:hypothetical protein